MARLLATIVVAIAVSFGSLSPSSAQSTPAGPVFMVNDSPAKLTVTKFRYVDRLGQTRTLSGEWELKPGARGYLLEEGEKIVARKVTYDLVTAEGKTEAWSTESGRLDADGDHSFRFSPANLAYHLQLLGKAPQVALKPVVAGPTPEQVARGAIKALGAAVFHQRASQAANGFADALGIELARVGRDELIKAAVDDIFPQLPAADRATLGRLVPLALDDRLTGANLREAEAKAEIMNHLRRQNPDFAFTAEAADFLYQVQQRAR